MKYIIIISIAFISTIYADSLKDGKSLYLEAKCQKCHLQYSKFDPNSINKPGMLSKVSNKSGIHKWVTSCDNYFDVGWFPSEQKEVAKYLNKVFYKYKE